MCKLIFDLPFIMVRTSPSYVLPMFVTCVENYYSIWIPDRRCTCGWESCLHYFVCETRHKAFERLSPCHGKPDPAAHFSHSFYVVALAPLVLKGCCCGFQVKKWCIFVTKSKENPYGMGPIVLLCFCKQLYCMLTCVHINYSMKASFNLSVYQDRDVIQYIILKKIEEPRNVNVTK